MPAFHQLRDGSVRVATAIDTYNMSAEDFEKRFNVTIPSLPEGFDERLYEPGVRHPLAKDCSVLDGGPMPWEFGDNIIARADAVVADWRKREEKAAQEKAAQDAQEAQERYDEEVARQMAEAEEHLRLVQAGKNGLVGGA